MITGFVEGDGEFTARLRALPDALRAELIPAMGRITLKLMRQSVQQKLSGQVLRRKTGTLARAVTQSPRTFETSEAIVGSVGVADITGPGGRAPVGYGRTHEYGFAGTVQVKEHLRTIKQAFGRKLLAPVQVRVRAHSASRNLPERSFLRSALRDLDDAGVIRQELRDAAGRAIARGAQ